VGGGVAKKMTKQPLLAPTSEPRKGGRTPNKQSPTINVWVGVKKSNPKPRGTRLGGGVGAPGGGWRYPPPDTPWDTNPRQKKSLKRNSGTAALTRGGPKTQKHWPPFRVGEKN